MKNDSQETYIKSECVNNLATDTLIKYHQTLCKLIFNGYKEEPSLFLILLQFTSK